jgi:hypothetical protein
MLISRGQYNGYDLYTTRDVIIGSVEIFEKQYGSTIKAAVEELATRRMMCETLIITSYQVLALPVPRYDFALATVFQIPHTIGDTVVTGESPQKIL